MKNIKKTLKNLSINICRLIVLSILLTSFNQTYAETTGSAPSYVTKPTTLKVVMVQFSDVKWDGFIDTSGEWRPYEKVHTLADFEALLASDGTYQNKNNSDGEPVYGSFRDYFWDMSKHTYRPYVIILNEGSGFPIWVQLTSSKLYYYHLGFPSGFYQFISDAKAAAVAQIPGVNPSDLDPSTTVKICYIYAGNFSPGINIATNYSEMAVPERNHANRDSLEYINDKIAHIGYFCHEFGHCMGYGHPDATVQYWALMRSGHKNGSGGYGNIPASMNPWFLYKADWANLNLINDYMPDTDLIYNTSSTVMNTYYVREFSGDRRYIVENRQQGNTFDDGLPHAKEGLEGGILIWDIKYSSLGSGTNTIKADNDGGSGMDNQAQDMFRPYGAYPYHRISDYSSPADLKLSSTQYSHFSIDNYYENGNTITIDFIPNYWEGEINTNTTWTASNSPYYVGTDITIVNGVTLTIEPNTTIYFNENTGLYIEGELAASGTCANPITFTSASASPAAGDWQGIVFDNGDDNSTINNCLIEYATVAVNINNTDLTIEQSTIKNNSGNGVKCNQASPTIYHNTIQNNGIGILCQLDSHPYINDNYIIANSSYGIFCTQTCSPKIRHNEISANNSGGGIACLGGFPHRNSSV